MRVRIIEDHPDIAELLALELARSGFDVDKRTSRFADLLEPDAWDSIDAGVFDLMLGDPDINGADLVFHVAANHPHIRRVILTATSETDVTGPLRDAAHVVLDKPTGIGRLSEVLRGAS